MTKILQTVPEIPEFDEEGKAPAAVPSLFNKGRAVVNQNFEAAEPILQDVVEAKGDEESLASRLSAVDTQLGALESSSAVAVSRAQELAWKASDEGFSFEMFGDEVHSWRNFKPVAVLKTVKDDDSVDVESTANLRVGSSYVIFGETGRAETVVVKKILTANRFQALSNLTVDRTSGTLSRTNWAIHSGYATVPNGGVLYSKPLDVLRYWSDGRMVIRRDSGDGVVSIAARQVDAAEWQAAEFLESSQEVSGTRDETYRIPVGGKIELRVVIDSGLKEEDTRVSHMMLLTSPKAGRADAVRKPVNLTPANEATGVMETPTLTANAYRSLYGLDQNCAEFRIASGEGMADVIYTATENGVALSHQVAADNLLTDSIYWWQCRYQDSEEVWSEWSEPTAFSTGSIFQYVAQPENVAPADGATNVFPCPTLQCSIFQAVGGNDTLQSIHYQVATDKNFTTVVYDVTDTTGLNSHRVTQSLPQNVVYYWRCRQTGQAFSTSAWSVPTSFTPHEVILPQGAFCGGTVDSDGKGILWDVPGTFEFTVPDGLSEVEIETIGGGASGTCWGGGGGGGGGYAKKKHTLVSGEKYTITVGEGGPVFVGSNENCYLSAALRAGKTSSFGNIVSSTGGMGGQPTSGTGNAGTWSGGPGGNGHGGDINETGGRGGTGGGREADQYATGGKPRGIDGRSRITLTEALEPTECGQGAPSTSGGYPAGNPGCVRISWRQE